MLAIVPRDDFTPGALGKKGCKYVGYWFEESENKAFWAEDYEDMPIAVARAVKIRGEVYGRSAGTMLISTIRCINEAVSDCMASGQDAQSADRYFEHGAFRRRCRRYLRKPV